MEKLNKFFKYFIRISFLIGMLLLCAHPFIKKAFGLESWYILYYDPVCYNCASSLKNGLNIFESDNFYRVKNKYCSHCGKADYGVFIKRKCSKCNKVYNSNSDDYCGKCGGKITDSKLVRLGEDGITLFKIRFCKILLIVGVLLIFVPFMLYCLISCLLGLGDDTLTEEAIEKLS